MAGAVAVADETRHGTRRPISRRLLFRQLVASVSTPLVATGLALCLVDLMTALLAVLLFGRVHTVVPGSEALLADRPQTLLLVLAAILALLPLLHLASKVFAHVARRSRRHAWLGTARVMLCAPASLCPVTVITLLLATGH
ncbi:hypothetical protein [Mesorhizobium loti]|uniref:Uncharacterized protein n=1 Tax=Mesorhizobium loti R88b TaxID=935548 RepID=A0A6M7WK49_RHILI|nr:hypothetical protein [Mesorhizobium loti]QKD02902.1 hypothetical protein EB235_16460 [Mesorhizobium loti R88b]